MIAYLLKNLETNEVLCSRNSTSSLNVASLIKVLYALEIVDRLDKSQINDDMVKVDKNSIEGYGTDVLCDLVTDKNSIIVNLMTLVGLMLKYSCNSSTKIIADKFLGNRTILQDEITKKWSLTKTTLVNNKSEIVAKSSLRDLSKVFNLIYNNKNNNWLYIQNKLKESRNIYYLFDRQEINILGSKSGTILLNSRYWISNCGVININDNKYFLGAVVSSKNMPSAINKIRKVGCKLIDLIRVSDNKK